jgi:hypothetical protein
MSTDQAIHGLDALKGRSLIETTWRRRTHRVSRGSDVRRADELQESPIRARLCRRSEEAVLMRATGCTGLSMPGPAVLRSQQRRADHGQAQRQYGRPHRRQS